MSMNRILTLGLVTITALVGTAQAEVHANFHLPFYAHWGQVTLAPGDYKISIPDGYRGTPKLLIEGKGKTGYIQPQVTEADGNSTKDPEHSYLQFAKVNGAYFVTQYRSAAIGETFRFTVPKQARHRSEKADQDTVKIGVGGN